MKIGSYLKFSLVDYPGQPSAVIFTKGCNMMCPYCHNYDLVNCDDLNIDDILLHLKNRRHLLRHVVISGGEPTLHSDLPDLCRRIKALGYNIKLDTNGTNPVMIRQLVKEKLVDYVAMDIKTSTKKYPSLTGIKMDEVMESIKIIKNFGRYEFRTTCYPEVDKEDIKEIVDLIGSNRYILQNYRQNQLSDPLPYPHTDVESWAFEYDLSIR